MLNWLKDRLAVNEDEEEEAAEPRKFSMHGGLLYIYQSGLPLHIIRWDLITRLEFNWDYDRTCLVRFCLEDSRTAELRDYLTAGEVASLIEAIRDSGAHQAVEDGA